MMKEQMKQAEEKMKKTLSVLSSDYAAIRAGRANPAVLDKIVVDYYGAPTPIPQMAAVSVAEARVLVVQPWDATALKSIEKAIQTSDLGINPTNDGKVLRIAFPQLTEERRREISKEVGKYCEDAKVAIRSIRRDTIDKCKTMKKNAEYPDDDQKNAEKEIQNLTDKYCKEADEMSAAKEKEIMSV